MSDEAEHLGHDLVEPDGFMQPRRYQVHFRCRRCGHEYSRIFKTTAGEDVPCPKKACKAAALEEEFQRRLANSTQIFESQVPPGHIGDNITVKAIDTTANVVMSDYNMTDLKDNIRHGESMAPKLPHQMQQAADNFFGGGNLAGGGVRPNSRAAKQIELIGKRALAGAYAGMAVNPKEVIGGQSGQSPLTLVRSERAK